MSVFLFWLILLSTYYILFMTTFWFAVIYFLVIYPPVYLHAMLNLLAEVEVRFNDWFFVIRQKAGLFNWLCQSKAASGRKVYHVNEGGSIQYLKKSRRTIGKYRLWSSSSGTLFRNCIMPVIHCLSDNHSI